MSPPISRKQTPEERELDSKKSDLAILEAELAERELDLATLQGSLHAFESRYLCIVGTCYAELDELEARLAEANLQGNPRDRKLHQQAAEARARAMESAGASGAAQYGGQNVQFAPADDLKRLYREVARRVHPDLTTDERERTRRHQLMAEANRAYEEGDEGKLRGILNDWQSSPESVEGEGIAAELVRTIRKLYQVKQRLSDIAAAIAQLTHSELYELKEKTEAALSNGEDLLAQMAELLRVQIALARARLDELAIPGTIV